MLTRLALFSLFAIAAAAQGTKADYERALSLPKRTDVFVPRTRVEPQWLGDTFTYRVEIAPGKFESVFVDCIKGTRSLDADAAKRPPAPLLAERKPRPSRTIDGAGDTSITFTNTTAGDVQLFWLDLDAKRQPYARLKAGETHKQHTFPGHVWLAEAAGGVVLGVYEGRADEATVDLSELPPAKEPEAKPQPPKALSEWKPFIRDFNVWVKNRGTMEEVQLSRDGTKDDAFSEPIQLSPDGKRLVAMQVQPEQAHLVSFIESSPKDQLQPKLHQHQYLKPGDRIRQEKPRLFDLASRAPIALDSALFAKPWDISDLRWAADSSHFTFLYNERGHQVLRIVKVTATGTATTLVEDTSPTFIDYSQKHWHQWLGDDLLWSSERDGWNHLYRFDATTGTLKNRITTGPWNVRSVERVEGGKLWLRVMGIIPEQDPYFIHLARVNLDGTGFTLLTGGDGTRTEKRPLFSPDGKWLVDTYSRVDMPPVTELRNAETGKLICELERANADGLLAAGWTLPERFTAKGRDGKTDIYGIIIRPSNFGPAKKYPIIEEIYAGPHGAFVPKAWGRATRQHALAELGFIVVQIDGMGTNWRGKAFQDIAWRNLKDGGFPDRIAWMRAAAKTRPWMDLTRVGIYGGSAGGQNALAGLLHHGDFYKAGVTDCGCHDNRMDKIWWNEAWMNEVGPWYAENSNVTHAAKLTGKLLLIVGEVDTNVDPASTLQVANALIKADKDFDLLIMPSTNHGSAETPYASRRRMDFFVRHLLHVEPRS